MRPAALPVYTENRAPDAETHPGRGGLINQTKANTVHAVPARGGWQTWLSPRQPGPAFGSPVSGKLDHAFNVG